MLHRGGENPEAPEINLGLGLRLTTDEWGCGPDLGCLALIGCFTLIGCFYKQRRVWPLAQPWVASGKPTSGEVEVDASGVRTLALGILALEVVAVE